MLERAFCKDCNQFAPIQNKTKQLCKECVYKRNHNGKSRNEVALEKRKTKSRKSKKVTGEKKIFIEIWEERDHICTNCGKSLGEEPFAQYFSHIKSKGSDSVNKLNKDNIRLLCFECHFLCDFQGRKNLTI